MAPPDTRRTLTKGQRTRQRLLRAAIQRFGDEGYRTTSVSQLSRDAGLTPAAAYAYFADKEAFWAAAIEADLDELDAEIRDPAFRGERPLFDLMSGLFLGLDQHPLARRVLAEGTEEDLRLVLRHKLFAGTTALITDRLEARRASGRLPSDASPATMARGIETVMFSLLLTAVRAGLSGDFDRLAAVVDLLRMAVGGPPTREEIEGA